MTDALKAFKESISGLVAELGEPGYDIAMWGDNIVKNARYVVTVRTAEDIAKAIKEIRGGGHSTSGGSAVEGGLLINTRMMSSVRVDKENMVVDIEAGAQSHDIELECMTSGVSTVVGSCGSVGIVGYATCGGVGFSTGEYGLGVDNIVSAIVVLADGQIVEANGQSHPDLYWGIRGGGSNFGVIARLRMKLHEQRAELYAISYTFVVAQLPKLVDTLTAWREKQNPWESIVVLMGLRPDGKPYIIVSGWCDRDQTEGEDSFRPFLEIGPVMVTHEQIPYTVWGTRADDFCAIPGNKITSGAYVDKFCLESMQKAYDTWLEVTKRAPMSIVIYEFYPFKKMAEIPVDATAFSQRKTDLIVLVCTAWTDAAFTESAEAASHRIRAAISSTSSESAQQAIPYANYSDLWAGQNQTDNHAKELFGPNYPRLREVKKKYDPEQVFNRWFAIRPAA